MLPSSCRLLSQHVPGVLRGGIRVRGEGIELIYKKTQHSPRFACVVPIKTEKKAVMRNRIKRLLREAIRRILLDVSIQIDGVFMVRGRLPDAEADVETIVRNILTKI